MTTPSPRRRLTSAAAVLAAGLAVAAATELSGDRQSAIVMSALAILGAVATYLWSGREGDISALLSASGDERQRSIDLRATAVAGLAMGAFSLVMAIVQMARGGDNPWVVVCAVGAVTYAGTLTVERLRS
jgi:uncharacterized protein YfiM (DUF2279 family)